MRSSSTVTGRTGRPSAATTVSFTPGMRTSKYDIADPLISRSRTRSPGVNSPVQLRGRRLPVHQVRVGRAADVGEVGGVHPHRRPGEALGERRAQSVALRVAHQVAQRPLADVVVVALLLEPAEHVPRILVGPVGEHHHVLAVVAERLRLARHDHQRPIDAPLLLEAGVRVVPVGAGLAHAEAIRVGRAGADAVEAETGDAVHVGGQEDAVPVNRRVVVERVRHAQRDRVAFAPAKQRPRQRPVDRQRDPLATGDVHPRLADAQVELGALQHAGVGADAGLGGGAQGQQAEAGGGAAEGHPFDERSSR